MTQTPLPLTRESQSAAILRDLKDGAVLDCMSILHAYNCNSGKQRIHELREAGWNIKGEWVELANKKRIKRWHLNLAQPFIPREKKKKERKIGLTRLRSLAREIADGDLLTEMTFSKLIIAAERQK